MFKRNKDLTEVFNDRWRANHNKALENIIKNNKSDIIKRSYGIESTEIRREVKKPLGYDNMNGR